MAYFSAYTNNINNQWTQCNKQTESSLQGNSVDNRQENSKIINTNHKQHTINIQKDARTVPQNSEVVKTRSGKMVKKPDRLSYTLVITISPANMSSAVL